jgi:hypothetical protein
MVSMAHFLRRRHASFKKRSGYLLLVAGALDIFGFLWGAGHLARLSAIDLAIGTAITVCLVLGSRYGPRAVTYVFFVWVLIGFLAQLIPSAPLNRLPVAAATLIALVLIVYYLRSSRGRKGGEFAVRPDL